MTYGQPVFRAIWNDVWSDKNRKVNINWRDVQHNTERQYDQSEDWSVNYDHSEDWSVNYDQSEDWSVNVSLAMGICNVWRNQCPAFRHFKRYVDTLIWPCDKHTGILGHDKQRLSPNHFRIYYQRKWPNITGYTLSLLMLSTIDFLVK